MKSNIFSPLPINDHTCGWSQALTPRQPKPALTGEQTADFVVVGAGYTGLSAARKFAELNPNAHVVIIDAQRAGEGASARNSGYLVDSTLNDGHMSDTGLQQYREKYALNKAGVDCVEQLVKDHNIDCDWDASGKFHATAVPAHEAKLKRFSQLLGELDLEHRVLNAAQLKQRLGTCYYTQALWTAGGVMLQPAKLARAYIELLPDRVILYENSPMLTWKKQGNDFLVSTPMGQVKAPNMLLAVNGFMASAKVKRQRAFPLTLTASMTRPLTDAEYVSLGSPKAWGLLSAQAMGATVRLTQDRRIMVRNTAEVWPKMNMSAQHLEKRKAFHLRGLKRRFPQLCDDLFDSCWSGITCISGNNGQVFDQLDSKLLVAGCYNGGGIGLATLFGEQMAYRASGQMTDMMAMIEARPKPNTLPPQPLLSLGVRLRLIRDGIIARKES
ncbi:MAG: FAD-binding oxidoreductase [Oceanospirillaceae bacterium]|nr:FAD-binding oxidoreductase [Oceanospirillaceae bacterium]